MVAFARDNGVPHDRCGKLVVATDDAEIARLDVLAERAEANGVPVKRIGPAQAREHEPNVSCVAALWVESTAIIDFPAVCAALVRLLGEHDLRLNTPVLGIRPVRAAGSRWRRRAGSCGRTRW